MADVEKVVPGQELEYLSRNVLDDKDVQDVDSESEENKEEVEDQEEELVEGTEDKGESEDKEDKEEEESESAADEDKEEVDSLDDSSVIDQVKKLAPDLLKKIPELRKILYSEQEYTKSFATPEEAKDAREAIEAYQDYERDLIAGESKGLLETLEKTNKESLKKFLGNFIPTVREHDQALWLQMVQPAFKDMLRAARSSKNENIAKSAENLHYFIFGDINFESEVGLKPKAKSEGESDLDRREREFNERKATSFYADIKTTVEKRLTRIIEKSLENTGMSSFILRKTADEIADRVDQAVRKDKRFQGNLRDLGQKARRNDFSTDGKDSIINAYLSRAKVQVSKIRQEVLKEAGVRASGETKKKVNPVRLSGAETKSTSGKVNIKDVDFGKKTAEYPQGYSHEDYLAGKKPPLKQRS